MRFFQPPDPNEAAKKQRMEASLQSIANGGLPLGAVERLKDQATRNDMFSSNFSVNELVLTHQCGFEPVGQVMGSSVYQIGWNTSIPWVAGEMTYLSQAHNEARWLAMNRLKMEAKLLKATGVVGVRIEATHFDYSMGLLEFKAIGTAVRPTGEKVADDHEPFVSGLSGQDHYTLLKTGYEPSGFVMETCSYYCMANWRTQNAVGYNSWYNQELTDFTRAQYAAREIAMVRVQLHAREQNGDGIVGVVLENSQRFYENSENSPPSLIINFTVMGTVVKKHGYWAATDAPELRMPLI